MFLATLRLMSLKVFMTQEYISEVSEKFTAIVFFFITVICIIIRFPLERWNQGKAYDCSLTKLYIKKDSSDKKEITTCSNYD